MRIFLLILTLLAMASVHADVYRSVNEDGNTVYSDKPSPDAEKIHIDKIQTIDPGEVEPFEYTPIKRDAEGVSPYTGVQIASPQNNDTIRSNAGELEVNVAINPGLIPGHQVVLYLDGNNVAEGGGQFELENIERGTHTLIAAIRSSQGNEIERSAPVTFTLQRVAASQSPANAPVSPTNPPKPKPPAVSPTNPPKPSP